MSTNENPALAGGVSEHCHAAKLTKSEHKADGAHAQATNETQLVKTIKAHLAKAEKYQGKATEHFIAAGQHLKTLKETSPDQATFLEIVKEQIGLGKSRTYELLQIADGTKTEIQIQQANAERKAKERAKLSVTSRTNDDDMPTREEAEESYQQTLRENGEPYDHQSPWAAHGLAAPASDEPEDEGDSEETCWRRGLLYRATNAAGEALYEDWSPFTVDSELVSAAELAAEAWAKTAAYLRELRQASAADKTAAAVADEPAAAAEVTTVQEAADRAEVQRLYDNVEDALSAAARAGCGEPKRRGRRVVTPGDAAVDQAQSGGRADEHDDIPPFLLRTAGQR